MGSSTLKNKNILYNIFDSYCKQKKRICELRITIFRKKDRKYAKIWKITNVLSTSVIFIQ